MTMLRVILWCLTVFESVSDSGNNNFDTCLYPRVKCGEGCVHIFEKNCEFTDFFHGGKHCCTDQTCTGAKRNCENQNDSYNENIILKIIKPFKYFRLEQPRDQFIKLYNSPCKYLGVLHSFSFNVKV